MRIITIIILSIFYTFGNAQSIFEKVNMDKIKKAVNDSSLESYYPKLIARWNSFDVSLTQAEYRLLYYGFVFNENYSGFDDRIHDVRDLIKSKKYQEAIETCDSILDLIPVSLGANYLKFLCLQKTNGNEFLNNKYLNRYQKLVEAIVSSGDGLKCKSGFKVIFVGDEYEIMYGYFDITEFKGQSLQPPCDAMSVEPSNKFTEKLMYFDAGEILKKEAEMFDGK